MLVPVHVVDAEGGEGHHAWAVPEIGDVEAAELEDETLASGAGRRIVGRVAEVAPNAEPSTELAQEVADHVGGGGLPLRAGDGGNLVAVELLEGEAHAPNNLDPRCLEREDLVAVARDAGGLDHDLAGHELLEATLRNGRHLVS